MGDMEQDFSVVHSSGSPGFGLFVVFSFGDCDLVSQKLCKIMSVGDECLFLGHFQMKFFTDKTAYVLFYLFCVLFTADNSYQKVICISDIANPFIVVIHRVAVRHRFKATPQLSDFSRQSLFFFFAHFSEISFEPFFLSTADI